MELLDLKFVIPIRSYRTRMLCRPGGPVRIWASAKSFLRRIIGSRRVLLPWLRQIRDFSIPVRFGCQNGSEQQTSVDENHRNLLVVRPRAFSKTEV